MFPSNNTSRTVDTCVFDQRSAFFRLYGVSTLWQSETMLTHTGICACVTTLPMEFRRYFTSVCRMAFCNGATTNAINSFHGMFPPIHSESGFPDPFLNRRHIRVIAYSIFNFRVAKTNSDNTTGATLRRRGLPNDDKRRRDY